jgi:hypothetical protein
MTGGGTDRRRLRHRHAPEQTAHQLHDNPLLESQRMKRRSVLIALAALVVAAAIYTFRAPLVEVAMDLVTRNMFVAAADGAYDPGVPVGAEFPPILALHEGREVTGLDLLMGDKGVLLFANRSVDW